MKKSWRYLSQIIARSGLAGRLGKTFGGDRDLWATLGYREGAIDINTYLSFYERGDIAAQIVDLPADTSWRYAPEIRLLDEKVGGQSFLDDVTALNDRVGLWSKMGQVDRLSGIGRYGLLVMGLRGEEKMSEPAPRITSLKDVLYLKAVHEGRVEIHSWDEDKQSERYGYPELYTVDYTMANGKGSSSEKVHWSRVIHVAENLTEDDVHGVPRLQRVINKLDDLNKLIGSSAEIFWLAVGGILHADLDPEVEVSETDMEDFEKDIVEAMHGLRRIIQTRGVSLSRIASSGLDVDPSHTYEALKELIAATARIPNRVLFGSERGELASSQDQRQWHATIKTRQLNHVEPVIIRPFFSRMEQLGAIKPLPWELHWPPLDEPTEAELADIADKKSKAAVSLAPGGQAEILIKPWEARELLGLPQMPTEPPEGAVEAFAEGVNLEVDE